MKTRPQLPTTGRRGAGFTIVELLIAVIIIGILVAIIIPIYVNRAESARESACLQDLDSLQTAEQHAGIDTGYFYRLFMLDDVKGGDGIAPSNLTLDVTDGVRDEILRTDAGNLPNFFLDLENGLILTNGSAIFTRMNTSETTFNWNGPYLNVSRKTGLKFNLAGYPAGLPVDPWGNPYLLFTKEGMVDERVGNGNGTVTTTYSDATGSYSTRVFDRPTVLSLGPNGIPGDGPGTNFGQGDDKFRQF